MTFSDAGDSVSPCVNNRYASFASLFDVSVSDGGCLKSGIFVTGAGDPERLLLRCDVEELSLSAGGSGTGVDVEDPATCVAPLDFTTGVPDDTLAVLV